MTLPNFTVSFYFALPQTTVIGSFLGLYLSVVERQKNSYLQVTGLNGFSDFRLQRPSINFFNIRIHSSKNHFDRDIGCCGGCCDIDCHSPKSRPRAPLALPDPPSLSLTLSLSPLSRVSTTVLIHGLTSTTCVPAGAERTHALTHVGDAGQGVHVRHTPSSHKHWVHRVMTFPIRFFVEVSFCTDSSSRLVEHQLPGHFLCGIRFVR